MTSVTPGRFSKAPRSTDEASRDDLQGVCRRWELLELGCKLSRPPSEPGVAEQLAGCAFDRFLRLLRRREPPSHAELVNSVGHADLALRRLWQSKVREGVHERADRAAGAGLRNHEVGVRQDE